MAPKTPDRITWAVEQLAVGPGDHILEIGCGTGVAAGLICAQLTEGQLTALDRSRTMIAAARRNNKLHLNSGKAVFLAASLAEFRSPPRRFDKALAVNVNVFWLEPEAELQVLKRVLKPGATLCLVFQPPTEAQVNSISRACSRQLTRHGFSDIRIVRKKLEPVQAICLRAAVSVTPASERPDSKAVD